MKLMNSPIRLPLGRLLCIACALVSFPLAAFASGIDEWYIVRLGDKRVGWMHVQEAERAGELVSRTEVQVEIGRGTTITTIGLESEFIETLDGKPLRMTTVQRLGAKPLTRTFRFENDRITAIVDQAGESTITTLDSIPGDWLTPAAARRFVLSQMESGATTLNYTTVDAMNGPMPLRITTTVVGPTVIETVGKTIPAIEWKTEQSAAPGVVTTEFVNADGVPIRTELSLGIIDLVVVSSERELALAEVEPAELLVSSFITPSRAIASARTRRSASYILSMRDGELGKIPSTSVQRVERLDDRSIRITIDLDEPAPSRPDEADEPRYSQNPSMINWRDSAIETESKRALSGGGALSSADTAERLRRYVHAFITEKNLDVGLASASEVCRTREGDCTEHAVLLAAMLRYAGVPSRIASGLIYADNFAGQSRIFGYHMWTQALIRDDRGDSHWIDLDATLPDDIPFDATHIALSVSSMADDEPVNSLAGLAPMLGRLEVEVVRTGSAGDR